MPVNCFFSNLVRDLFIYLFIYLFIIITTTTFIIKSNWRKFLHFSVAFGMKKKKLLHKIILRKGCLGTKLTNVSVLVLSYKMIFLTQCCQV